jgi:hypothetical protein
MGKKLRIYSLSLLAFLLFVTSVRAGDALRTVQKTIVKKIAIARNLKLNINNQYGDVVIQNWKLKSAMVQVTITGKSVKSTRANALIRYVRIKTRNKPGETNLETAIDTLSQHIDPASGEECHISYVVFVPRAFKLSVTNRFGDIHVKSFDGDLTIDEKFGDLKVEHTSGLLNINVEQGNADIDRLRGGLLKFKGFNNVRIGELSGIVDAKFWSGGSVDLALSDDLQKLDIDAANVKPLNITNLKPANADLKIHSKVSKIIYNGHILLTLSPKKPLNLTLEKPLKTDTVLITGKGDTTQKPIKLDLKRIKIIGLTGVDYTLKTGTATTPIRISASFCVVDVKD